MPSIPRWMPLSLSGSVRVRNVTNKTTLKAAIARALEKEKPRWLQTDADGLSFRGGLLRFVGRGNLLVAISWGEVRVCEEGAETVISYRLWFTEVVGVAGAMSCWLVAAAAGASAAEGSFAAFALLFLWLAGGNVLFGLHQFRSTLKRLASEAR